MQISVTILTRNSGKTLRQCLASLSFSDDIVILDGNSTDDTRAIAAEFGARVYPQYETSEQNVVISNFTELRKKSFAHARHDWVMYVDSDEYCDESLQQAIKNFIAHSTILHVAYVDRHPLVDGHEIKHAYFLPDRVARIVNKQSGIVWKEGATVHESFVYPEGITRVNLEGVLYSYWPNARDCITKDNYYLRLSREKLERDIAKKSFPEMWRGLYRNLARAAWILLRILYSNIRYFKQDVLPLKYHLRFVRYHILMAISWDKWIFCFKYWWKQTPKFVRMVVYLAIMLRLIALLALVMHGGERSLVYNVNGDATEYVAIAHNIVYNHVYSLNLQPPFVINSYRAPGFPALLIMLGGAMGHFITTALFQNILSIALIGIVYQFVRKEVSERAARVSAVLMAFEPNMIFWPQQLVTETVHMFFLTVAIIRLYYFLITRRTSSLLWGLLWLVIATYVRPATYPLLYLLPFLPLVFFLGTRSDMRIRVKQVCASIALVVLTITPWMYHNYRTLGSFQFAPAFATRGSVGKYLSEYTYATFGKKPYEVYPELAGPYDENPQDAHKIINRVIETATHDPLVYARIVTKFTMPFFVGDGWYTMYITYRGTQDVSIPSATLESNHLTGISAILKGQSGIYITGKVLYGLMSLAMIVGLGFLLKKKHTRLLGIVMSLAILYYVLVAGVGSYARFRYPIQPCMFIAIGALALYKRKTPDAVASGEHISMK